MTSLDPLFRPRAIAVIGASRKKDAVGGKIVACLIEAGFPGPIFPVNPNATEIESLRCYSSLEEVPRPVDLAVIAVPASFVLEAIESCHRIGVKAVVVISAGFAEIGPEGKSRQDQLLEKVRRYGIRMVGPNCFGVLNTDPTSPLNASFSSVFAIPGGIAMASQSGAMGLAILSLAKERQLGLSQFVSVGNKADISSNDLVDYWETEERTKVILLYLESFGNPSRFAQIARRVSRKKPIIAIKSGRSQSGSRAAGSHTAALAASDVAVDALFHQAGVLRVDTVHEMFQLALGFECQPIPKGERVAILTNAGGPAILCADACEASGLIVPPLQDSTLSQLRTFLPSTASLTNPVDMIAVATPTSYRRASEILLNAPEVDALIIIHTVIDRDVPEGLEQAILDGVLAARNQQGKEKPVFFCLMKNSQAQKPLRMSSEAIPVYPFPEEAARALGQMATYGKWCKKPQGDFATSTLDLNKIKTVLEKSSAEGEWLSSESVREVLELAQIPALPCSFAATKEEAITLARRFGYPTALKLSSKKITHKTEVGGVQLNLANDPAVANAFSAIEAGLKQHFPTETLEGVIVQPMAPRGIEIFVGMVRDPLFGPLIGFGLGGVLVEITSDIRFRLAPLSRQDAKELIREIRGIRLLEGYRGMPGADLIALENLLLNLSELSVSCPDIQTLDLNPVIALPPGQGCVVVDARMRRFVSR